MQVVLRKDKNGNIIKDYTYYYQLCEAEASNMDNPMPFEVRFCKTWLNDNGLTLFDPNLNDFLMPLYKGDFATYSKVVLGMVYMRDKLDSLVNNFWYKDIS